MYKHSSLGYSVYIFLDFCIDRSIMVKDYAVGSVYQRFCQMVSSCTCNAPDRFGGTHFLVSKVIILAFAVDNVLCINFVVVVILAMGAPQL